MRDERGGIRGRHRISVLVAALAVALPSIATGETGRDEAPDERERWVPAISVFGGFLTQKQTGSVTSGDVLGPRDPSLNDTQSPLKIRPDAAGSDTPVAALVGGSLELMAPRLFQAGGSPRLFAHGDLAASFSDERTIAGEAKPGPFTIPPLPPNENLSEPVITGQGSRTNSQLEPLIVSAGIGVAFSVQPWERRIRIKPSFEYIREEIQVTGIVHRAVQLVNPAPPANGLESFRLIALSASEKKIFDGIGPGLEVEGDAGRAGPFMLSVYLSGQGYYFLGNRKVVLSDTNEYGETAVWNWEQDAWGWRGNVGLRFRWLPD